MMKCFVLDVWPGSEYASDIKILLNILLHQNSFRGNLRDLYTFLKFFSFEYTIGWLLPLYVIKVIEVNSATHDIHDKYISFNSLNAKVVII